MSHAVFAAIASGQMQLEGDIRPVFQQMLTLSAWIDVARALSGTPSRASDPEWHDEWQVIGRYVNVTLDGHRHKVFYFEAGNGIPGCASTPPATRTANGVICSRIVN